MSVNGKIPDNTTTVVETSPEEQLIVIDLRINKLHLKLESAYEERREIVNKYNLNKKKY